MWLTRRGAGRLAVFSLALLSGAAYAQTFPLWTPSWGAAVTAPYGTETLPEGALSHATLRQVVHLSTGGARIELGVTNVFGATPLELKEVHVALRPIQGGPGIIDPVTDRVVLFNGKGEVTLPAGSEFVSDPIDLPVKSLSDLVITMSTGATPEVPTVHAGARATSFLQSGMHAKDAALPSSQTFARWYFLDGVLVSGAGAAPHAMVALGDSITDGHGATTDGNDRWTDVLAARLNAGSAGKGMGVVNSTLR